MRPPLPPRPVRRVVLAPVVVLLTALVLSLTPIVVLVLAFAVRVLPGRWRALRLFWFVLVYLVRESIGIFALGALWLLSGFGWRLRSERFELAHLALMGWFLRGLVTAASRVLGLVLVTETPPTLPPRRPVLVFSRHAGAGDSLILVHLLVNTYHRRPHIVLKDTLQLDPCVDVVLNRLPNRFIRTDDGRGAQVVGSIRELAGGIEADGALILFPEGGNFSEDRRTRAIERLERDGHHDAVALAHELTFVLPPRPGGAFAAIDAAPEADVLFVAHTGLEQLSNLRDLWNGLPMDRQVRLAWWREPADQVPEDPEQRVGWLYRWWEQIDTWIEQRRDPDRPATPAVAPAAESSEVGPTAPEIRAAPDAAQERG